MRKFLPKLIIVLLFFVIGILYVQTVFADPVVPTLTPAPGVMSAGAATPTTGGSPTGTTLPDNVWVSDSEVTFVGKMAARSNDFVNWTLRNYDWSAIEQGRSNPLAEFWKIIVGIVSAFFAFFVLITAFLLVFRRITLQQFIVRFIVVALLIVLSFSIIANVIYPVTDVIQGMFLKNPDYTPSAVNVPQYISSANLLNIGFKYETFEGYRLTGAKNDEAAFVSLLLIRLTALTYYVMAGLLLVRKVILWFFLVISPVFPLLLLYAPIRNTAKIWLGEFFRWLLYAPIFAIFLKGLVMLWRAEVFPHFSIPLEFNYNPPLAAADIVSGISSPGYIYPTAINILLGGPGQQVALGNSLNYTDTFVQYIIALIMVWVVILLPFLLLQIFLDYLHTVAILDTNIVKQIINSSSSVFQKPPQGISPITPPIVPFEGAGFGRQLPFANKVSIQKPTTSESRTISQNQSNAATASASTSPSVFRSQGVDREVLRLADISVPTIRDIARFETNNLKLEKDTEVTRIQETLTKIANPVSIASPIERERFNIVKQRLIKEQQSGNPVATSILSAATITSQNSISSIQNNVSMREFLQKLSNPASVSSSIERQRITAVRNDLLHKRQGGHPLATTLLQSADSVTHDSGTAVDVAKVQSQLMDAKVKNDPVARTVLEAIINTNPQGVILQQLPALNRIQSVSIDDYESVKKMWTENYQKLEPPKSLGNEQADRASWIKQDSEQIAQTIALLSSADPQKVKEGMENVSQILPFLLIGGFSQTEVIAYLRAKLEAAKAVNEELKKKDEEEGTLLSVEKKKEEQAKHMIEEQPENVEEINKKIDEINTQVSIGNLPSEEKHE